MYLLVSCPSPAKVFGRLRSLSFKPRLLSKQITWETLAVECSGCDGVEKELRNEATINLVDIDNCESSFVVEKKYQERSLQTTHSQITLTLMETYRSVFPILSWKMSPSSSESLNAFRQFSAIECCWNINGCYNFIPYNLDNRVAKVTF